MSMDGDPIHDSARSTGGSCIQVLLGKTQRVVAALAPPVLEVHASFLAAMAEFRAEGRGSPMTTP
jgi:hypothetical protein